MWRILWTGSNQGSFICTGPGLSWLQNTVSNFRRYLDLSWLSRIWFSLLITHYSFTSIITKFTIISRKPDVVHGRTYLNLARDVPAINLMYFHLPILMYTVHVSIFLSSGKLRKIVKINMNFWFIHLDLWNQDLKSTQIRYTFGWMILLISRPTKSILRRIIKKWFSF